MEQKIKDRLLGMMAVEKGLLKEKDLTKCLNIAEFEEHKTMKDIMVDQKMLTPFQADKLEHILERQSNPDSARPPIKPSKLPFGELAVERGMLKQTQVDAALAEQREFASAKVTIPIGMILMSKGEITPEQVAELIERQGRRRLECVHCSGKQFNITGYDEDMFYRCPTCNGDLTPCEIESVERSKLTARLESIRRAKQPKTAPARPAPAAAGRPPTATGAAPARKAVAAPTAAKEKANPFDDDDLDPDDDDDDLDDLMILEL